MNTPGRSNTRFMKTPRQSAFFRDLNSTTTTTSSSPNPYNTTNSYTTPTPKHHHQSPLLNGHHTPPPPSSPDLPPPPNFTLEDTFDLSPQKPHHHHHQAAPPSFFLPTPSETTPNRPRNNPSGSFSFSPINANPPSPGNYAPAPTINYGLFGMQNPQKPTSPDRQLTDWTPAQKKSKEDTDDAWRRGSPVIDQINQQEEQEHYGRLITLPPPQDVVRPEIDQRVGDMERVLDDQEWVTIFGFTPTETNVVLREFEKCGLVLRHVPGPGEANWMHILYQNRHSAQKALQKNGMQINGILFIGVKPLDQHHRQLLTEKTNGLMPMPLQSTGRCLSLVPARPASKVSINSNEIVNHSSGAMASPSKSALSKLVDLMFGI